MKLIEDLGVVQLSPKERRRCGIYECPLCKKHYQVRTKCVNSGNTTMCKSCATTKHKTKHGLYYHPLYRVWQGIKRRCYNPNDSAYERYGGIGIVICAEWKNNPKAFYDWALSNGYEKGLQIDKDRLSKELNVNPPMYSPETCEFVTPSQNSRSRKSNVVIKYRGEEKILKDWCIHLGLSYTKVHQRIKRGWSIEKSFQRL